MIFSYVCVVRIEVIVKVFGAGEDRKTERQTEKQTRQGEGTKEMGKNEQDRENLICTQHTTRQTDRQIKSRDSESLTYTL